MQDSSLSDLEEILIALAVYHFMQQKDFSSQYNYVFAFYAYIIPSAFLLHLEPTYIPDMVMTVRWLIAAVTKLYSEPA